jgi:hypothetical protein
MPDPNDLPIIIEQLRRSNRRWKALALAACSVLILATLLTFAGIAMQRMRAETQLRAANEALMQARMAASQGQPR